jgi:hypothetical protein
MDRVQRSVNRDVQAISLGLPRVEAEITKLEKLKKKPKSVKKRLERLYQARLQLKNSTAEERVDLVQQLKAINNG